MYFFDFETFLRPCPLFFVPRLFRQTLIWLSFSGLFSRLFSPQPNGFPALFGDDSHNPLQRRIQRSFCHTLLRIFLSFVGPVSSSWLLCSDVLNKIILPPSGIFSCHFLGNAPRSAFWDSCAPCFLLINSCCFFIRRTKSPNFVCGMGLSIALAAMTIVPLTDPSPPSNENWQFF